MGEALLELDSCLEASFLIAQLVLHLLKYNTM